MATTCPAPDYVQFNEDLCTGCALCVKACPTKAIRVRDTRHICFVDQCIGCGECVRVCPTGAATSRRAKTEWFETNQYHVAVVSPLLYTQFPRIMPGYVRKSLRQKTADNGMVKNRIRGSKGFRV